MLEVRELSVAYGAVGRGLSNVDLDVGPDEAIALLGPNGAGKTSSLRGDLSACSGSGLSPL